MHSGVDGRSAVLKRIPYGMREAAGSPSSAVLRSIQGQATYERILRKTGTHMTQILFDRTALGHSGG